MAPRRIPVHTITKWLGLAGLVFALLTLGLWCGFMLWAYPYPARYFLSPMWLLVGIRLAACIVAAALTIVSAYKNSRGIVIAAMVFLIIGEHVALMELTLSAGILSQVILEDVDFCNGESRHVIGFISLLVVAACSLGMSVVFIWALINMCRFLSVGCGSSAPEATTSVLVPKWHITYPEEAPPAYRSCRTHRSREEHRTTRVSPYPETIVPTYDSSDPESLRKEYAESKPLL